MIVRGTTPYHSFIIPLEPEKISELYVTYLQNNEVIIDKTITDISIEPVEEELENASMEEPTEFVISSQVTIHLTQEDTLGFHFYPAAEKNIAVIQVRVLTTDGEAYASNPVHERIFGVLKDGVIQ